MVVSLDSKLGFVDGALCHLGGQSEMKEAGIACLIVWLPQVRSEPERFVALTSLAKKHHEAFMEQRDALGIPRLSEGLRASFCDLDP